MEVSKKQLAIIVILLVNMALTSLLSFYYILFLPILIPISVWIYYSINKPIEKEENATVTKEPSNANEKTLDKTVYKPITLKSAFKKPITLRLLITTLASLIILIIVFFLDFRSNSGGFLGGVNALFYVLISFSILPFIIFRFLPKDLKLPKLSSFHIVLFITFSVIILSFLLIWITTR